MVTTSRTAGRPTKHTLDWIAMGGERAARTGWFQQSVLALTGRTETDIACMLNETPVHRCMLRTVYVCYSTRKVPLKHAAQIDLGSSRNRPRKKVRDCFSLAIWQCIECGEQQLQQPLCSAMNGHCVVTKPLSEGFVPSRRNTTPGRFVLRRSSFIVWILDSCKRYME